MTGGALLHRTPCTPLPHHHRCIIPRNVIVTRSLLIVCHSNHLTSPSSKASSCQHSLAPHDAPRFAHDMVTANAEKARSDWQLVEDPCKRGLESRFFPPAHCLHYHLPALLDHPCTAYSKSTNAMAYDSRYLILLKAFLLPSPASCARCPGTTGGADANVVADPPPLVDWTLSARACIAQAKTAPAGAGR